VEGSGTGAVAVTLPLLRVSRTRGSPEASPNDLIDNPKELVPVPKVLKVKVAKLKLAA